MKKKNNNIKRVFNLLRSEVLVLFVSLFNGLFYVIFNSISIWLTASLVNNVLSDYSKLVEKHNQLLQKQIPTINDKLNVFVNNLILRDSNIETLKILCFSIISIFILKNLFLYLKNLTMSIIQLRLVTKLRNDIYKHIQMLPLRYFNKRKYGDITSVIINDVGTFNKSIGTTFHKIIVEPINIVFFTILLFIISAKLMLVAVLIIPFSQFLIQFIGKSIRRKARRNTRQIGGILAIITENISSIRLVKAFSTEKNESKRFNEESWKYYNLLLRSAKLKHISSPIIEAIGVSMAVLLLWMGGSEVIVGKELSSEDFLRFMFLLFSMLAPIRSLSNVNITLQNGYASAERIFELLDERSEAEDFGKSRIYSINSGLRFENVKFRYGDESFSLDNISFKLKKGCMVALVGESGSGKSTIADLIPRFYNLSNGSIKIDDKNINDISLKSLRNLMGIVTQETILLNTDIKSNIVYGSDKINVSMLKSSALAANAIEFIEQFKDGFDTIVGEKGVRLSGGQKQRIAIARAIYRNPPLLILDEATSALDSQSEKKVQIAIENLMQDRTVLVIAHRLSTVKRADQIIVLKDGRIIEKGNHKNLYKNEGVYYNLYNSQFDN
ncbi:MAG: ABC transporter ATP-binding protein [Candidatus Neomarinimicrobiota bacterium]